VDTSDGRTQFDAMLSIYGARGLASALGVTAAYICPWKAKDSVLAGYLSPASISRVAHARIPS